MTFITKPKLHHPKLPVNRLGFTRRDYEGAVSTLCAGCGHDSISGAIIQACFELELAPHRIAKLSGIGCSSKTPAYFLGNSHGFNTVHGRMPSVLRLRKLSAHYDPNDRIHAITYLQERQAEGEIVTGLLYVEPDAEDMHAYLNTVDTPLNALAQNDLVPGAAALGSLNASLR